MATRNTLCPTRRDLLRQAAALAAQVAGAVDGISVALAWGYVGLRVIHSFVQATRNVILVRFFVFAAASLVLLLLLLRTVLLLV